MEPTKREKQFIRETLKAAPRQQHRFVVETLGVSLGFSAEESRDIFQSLLKNWEYMEWRANYKVGPAGGVENIHSPDGWWGGLSRDGRLYARQMRDDDSARRRAFWWSATKWTWATLLTIAVPLWGAYINHRLNQLEGEAKTATNSATHPAPQSP